MSDCVRFIFQGGCAEIHDTILVYMDHRHVREIIALSIIARKQFHVIGQLFVRVRSESGEKEGKQRKI